MEELEQDLPVANFVPSDEENDINFINKTKTRNRQIMDSDSDSEIADIINSNTVTTSINDVEKTVDVVSENEQNNCKTLKRQHKRIAVVESDSESESYDLTIGDTAATSDVVLDEKEIDSTNPQNELINNYNLERIPKNIVNFDKDSDDDNFLSAPHNKNFPDEGNVVEDPTPIYNMNSKGKLLLEGLSDTETQKSRLAALCDSESSDEGSNYNNYNEISNEENVENQGIKKKVSKKSRTVKEAGPKKMTGKEAAEQRREIQSESQRMVRESQISLPYHKPRSYTLKEFLQKRSKLSSIVPTKGEVRPSVAIKMSKDQLEAVSKKLDERIKEVEEFYKSESEPEDENNIGAENTETVTNEIRSWIDDLVDNAVTQSETQLEDANDNEIELNVNPDLEVPETLPLPEPMELDNTDTQHQSIEYEFNFDDINEDETDIPKPPSKFDLIKEKVANICPKLSGGPDDVIDLEEGVTRPNAVKQLVEKFLQHTAKRPSHKHKVQLNVVSVNGGEICEETVAMNVDEDEDLVDVEVPGVKRQKLRNELHNQMAQKRAELWRQKKLEPICPVKEDDEKKSDYEDNLLDDEEEMEMTESSSDEELEDDLNEEPRVKSAFVDDEADEDYQDEPASDLDDGFDGDDESVDGENILNINDDGSEKSLQLQPKRKVLKRIVAAFREDSDDEDEVGETNQESKVTKEITSSETTDNCLEINASGEEDSALPPNLPRIHKSPQILVCNKPELDFLTPVTYLTGIQSLNNSESKESPLPNAVESSSVTHNWQSELHKKLFEDEADLSQSQCNIEELSELCSGKFPETQEVPNDVSTQDLVNVCSGSFPEPSQVSANNPEINLSNNHVFKPSNEINYLTEEQDQIFISQLIDEDELEQFKKRFESPVVPKVTPKSVNDELIEEVNATGLINSDDENDELELKQRNWKKKLVFSDDSSEDDEIAKDDEEINLHDTDGESLDLPPENVEYDSEENEIVVNEKPGRLKINDFFENEAELSESEWGSADEDEKELDQMEGEQGDAEKFDETKVRNDLEKIHMRRMLDDDTREVKFLQELLLEDGELHGAGRQRQFKWKNIDTVGNDDDNAKADDEDNYLDEEEESEEQFRKMRHEREMFLKKKSQSDDVGNIFNDSQVLKISQKVITKSLSLTAQTPPIEESDNIVTKQPFSLLNKRGSFLARNDEVLERLVEYTKVSTNSVGTTKTKGRSFVFQTTTSIQNTTIEKDNKRKATEVSSNPRKKLKLSMAGRRKPEDKSSGSNTMFSNW